MRPDLCATDCKASPRKFLGKFYTDALVHDHRALDLLVDVIGEVVLLIITINVHVFEYGCELLGISILNNPLSVTSFGKS